MKKNRRKHGKSQREIDHSVRAFWGGVCLVGLFAVLLMYVGLV